MQIERRAGISRREFVDEYLRGNKPLIVTGAIETWDLFWRPEEWGRRFGAELVQVYNDLFDLINVKSLNSFIREFMGKSEADGKMFRAKPYVRWYAKLRDVDFVWADEVFRQLSDRWSLPDFLPDSDYLLPYSDRRRLNPATDAFPKGLFISGVGARTRLHRDPWASDAVLCQLFGQKRVVFFSPAQEHIVVRNGVTVDIDNPDPNIFSNFAEVLPAAEGVLQTGEVLFIPRGWYHHVRSLTDSISLSWNFVHISTRKWFLQHLNSVKSSEEREVLRYFSGLPPGKYDTDIETILKRIIERSKSA